MKILKIIAIILLAAISANAMGFHRFSVGLNTGYTTLSGGTPPWYTVENTYGLKFDTHFKNNWRLGFGYSKYKIYDDSSAGSEFKFGSDDIARGRALKGYDLAMFFDYRLMPYTSRFSASAGFGGGISVWKIADADADTTLKAIGERGETVDLAATEVMLLSKVGLEYRFHPRFKLGFDIYANYLTGAGLEFEQAFEDDLSKWQLKATINLIYMFGMGGRSDRWKSGKSQEIVLQPIHDVGKNVPKAQEVVIPVEKRADADGDGIPDFNDDCPGTPRGAYGLVDLRGCPVDVDCDGVPDYLDKCPRNRLGALVDDYGCPRDSDNDGVPDGLDDCPGSDSGLAVDHSGCIDLSVLEKPVILNIKYQSGSFEIDRATRGKLNGIARILIKAPGVRVEINGYTDNIGTSDANKSLSQKRANRVRDYLVEIGVDSDRLTPVGRGEMNFITSNDTREGRQRNRRVELVFLKE